MSLGFRIRKMSLLIALDKYYQTVSVHKRGYKQEFYRANVIKKHPLVQKNMDSITTVDIASYRDDRLSQINPNTGRSISGNTVRLELAHLSALFNIARVEWGTCKTNPVEHVRKPKVSSGRDRRLTSTEERRLSRYFKERQLHLHIIFHLAIETAMRQGEILSLRWENVDLQLGVAHLPETKNGTSRDVPLSKKARNMLQLIPAQISGPVFSYTSDGFKAAWRTAWLTLGIENLHFHDLRHEAISRLFELGTLNVMEIAAISGHRSMNMLKRYTHLRAYQLVRKLDARQKQTQKIAPYFVPYPAHIETFQDGEKVSVRVSLNDFENLIVSDKSKANALEKASVLLLRTLAIAAQKGERVPSPGELPINSCDSVMICPLNMVLSS